MFQIGLIEHVQGSALLLRQFHHVDAADEQVVVLHFRGHRQNRTQLQGGAAIRLCIGLRCGHRHAGSSIRGNRALRCHTLFGSRPEKVFAIL